MSDNPYSLGDLDNDDIPGAVAMVKSWLDRGSDPSSRDFRDAVSILYRMQEDPDALAVELAKVIPSTD